MIRTRSFLILVLPVSLRTRFPRPDFHGQTPLIRMAIMDEYGVGFFLLSSLTILPNIEVYRRSQYRIET